MQHQTARNGKNPYEERPQARHQKRRPIWRVERPEDLETQHNFANPGEEKTRLQTVL